VADIQLAKITQPGGNTIQIGWESINAKKEKFSTCVSSYAKTVVLTN
jgi:hypothetical protein